METAPSTTDATFSVSPLKFDLPSIQQWASEDERHRNWPVVYVLDGPSRVYVGETVQAATRLRTHAKSDKQEHIQFGRVILNDRYNKSACHDLESTLIRLFSGDGKYQLLNTSPGHVDSNYYQRADYRREFRQIFESLRKEGLFENSIEEIENSELFKLSPYIGPRDEQRDVVHEVVARLLQDIKAGQPSSVVIQGGPGTGKTVVGIFLFKLIADIKAGVTLAEEDARSAYADLFTDENRALLKNFNMGFVVPMQALHSTVRKVFKNTSGLAAKMVLNPFQVGGSAVKYDLLVVDETHRLQRFNSQPVPANTTRFKRLNAEIVGDELSGTQLDWIRAKSRHSILLLDSAQGVLTADIPREHLAALVSDAKAAGRWHELTSQMRVEGGEEYIEYVRAVFTDSPPEFRTFPEYEFAMVTDFGALRDLIRAKDKEVGLSRLVAGFAWPWASNPKRTHPATFDIELDGVRIRWNSVDKDWVPQKESVNEVGCIHTVQGYDLNFAGVIIGNDLGFDTATGQIIFRRKSYFDPRAARNINALSLTFDDDVVAELVKQIYFVLLTRGIMGTFIYVCDPDLRDHLSSYIPTRHAAESVDFDV